MRLGAGAPATLAPRPTRDLEAYDLYLKGRFAWNQRTAAALPEAVRYLEQAVARDSRFARPWAGLADAYLLLAPCAGAPRAETWPRARAAAERALAIDGTLAEAHTSLGYGLMIYDWSGAEAEASRRRGIAANSNYATGHQWYADFLAGRGRLEDTGLGDLTRAFGYLDRAVEERDIFLPEDFSDPLLEPLRHDPRFARVRERRGLGR